MLRETGEKVAVKVRALGGIYSSTQMNVVGSLPGYLARNNLVLRAHGFVRHHSSSLVVWCRIGDETTKRSKYLEDTPSAIYSRSPSVRFAEFFAGTFLAHVPPPGLIG